MTLTKLLRAAFATKPRPKARRRLSLEALESRWCPAGGQLDTTFNGTGTRTLPYTTLGQSWDSAIQPDGKIVTVGSSGTGSSQKATVVRMNADGSLDSTFNGTGRLVLPQKVAGCPSTTACRWPCSRTARSWWGLSPPSRPTHTSPWRGSTPAER